MQVWGFVDWISWSYNVECPLAWKSIYTHAPSTVNLFLQATQFFLPFLTTQRGRYGLIFMGLWAPQAPNLLTCAWSSPILLEIASLTVQSFACLLRSPTMLSGAYIQVSRHRIAAWFSRAANKGKSHSLPRQPFIHSNSYSLLLRTMEST